MYYTLYHQFEDACKVICNEFTINPNSIKITQKTESPKIGVDYNAEMGKDGFKIEFHIRTESDKTDPTDGNVSGTITFYDSETRRPRSFHENLGPGCILYSNLPHWIKCIAYRYHLENHPINLKNLLRGTHIKVYGVPDYSEPTDTEFKILITGLSCLLKDNLISYRFRYLDEQSLSFSYSYGIYLPDNLWIIFPHAAGGGGGGGQTDFEFFEKQLNKRRKYGIERKYFDIEYEKLEKFLIENELKFEHSTRKRYIQFPLVSDKIRSSSERSFLNGSYSDAVFRATIVLEKAIKKKSGINKIGVPLINTVFDENNPILNIVEGSETEHKDERAGFYYILKGVFLGIKNPKSHSLPEIENPFIASQYLSFIDLLLSIVGNSKKSTK